MPWPMRTGMGAPPKGGGPTTFGTNIIGGDETANETMQNVELPMLAADANSLTPGDWSATVEPLVADVSQSAGEWWNLTLRGVGKELRVLSSCFDSFRLP